MAAAVCVLRGRSPGQIYRRGMPGFFDGNGGMRGAGAWRLHGNFWEFLGFFGRVIGAPCDTPWGCGVAVWNGSGEDVPVGYAGQLDGNGGMRVAWV